MTLPVIPPPQIPISPYFRDERGGRGFAGKCLRMAGMFESWPESFEKR